MFFELNNKIKLRHYCVPSLTAILTEATLLRLAERIGDDQLRLGIRLGMTQAEINKINRDHPNDTVAASLEMLMVTRVNICSWI